MCQSVIVVRFWIRDEERFTCEVQKFQRYIVDDKQRATSGHKAVVGLTRHSNSHLKLPEFHAWKTTKDSVRCEDIGIQAR